MRALTPLLSIAALGCAFVLGRVSVFERFVAPGLSGGEAKGTHLDGTAPVERSGISTGETATEGERTAFGFDAARTIDSATTMSGLMAMVANEPPGLSRFALLHKALEQITARNWHD